MFELFGLYCLIKDYKKLIIHYSIHKRKVLCLTNLLVHESIIYHCRVRKFTWYYFKLHIYSLKVWVPSYPNFGLGHRRVILFIQYFLPPLSLSLKYFRITDLWNIKSLLSLQNELDFTDLILHFVQYNKITRNIIFE